MIGRQVFILVAMCIGLIGCRPEEAQIVNERTIVGTWIAVQEEEDLNTYEFFDDGTGLMRDSREYNTFLTPIPFVYSFVDQNLIEFSAEEGHSILIDLEFNPDNNLSYDARVAGGYHIDFERVGACPYKSLKNCIVGRWVRYFPNGTFTLYDFYNSGEGVSYPLDSNEKTWFSFEEANEDTILYQVGGKTPTEMQINMLDNYKMTLDSSIFQGELVTLYRIGAPFGP